MSRRGRGYRHLIHPAGSARSTQSAAATASASSSGGDVLAATVHVVWSESDADDEWQERESYTPDESQGISVFRWAQSVDDVHAVLGNPRADELGAVPILNSWGADYPARVWMPDDVFDRLMREDGEVAIPTDR